MAVWALFLLDVLRDFSERSRSRSRAFRGASWTSGGFRECVLSKTAGAGSRLKDDRLHRWGRPFWGLRAPRPVRTATSGCGLLRRPEGRMSTAPSCLRFVHRQARTTGRNRRFPDVRVAKRKELAVDRAAKKGLVTTLNGVFKGTSVVVVAHYSGLNVAQMQTLRRQ